MTMRAYPRYKDSGVEWFGEIPEHWEVDRLKRSVASCRNGIWGNEPQGDDFDIPCVRVADFDRARMRVEIPEPTIRNVTERERQGRLLGRGILLLEKSGGGELQPVGFVALYDLDVEAVCSNFVARMELAEGMNPSFWRYFHAAAYSVRLNSRSIKQTSGIQNLDQSQYLDERVGFPPLSEQAAIAAFLDRETAKIDALVAEQRRLIELLTEKRRAVISHAVTKGLNPDAPMKHSGIDWLGEVPEHWAVMPVRYAAKLESGHTPSRSRPDWWVNCTVPWISLSDVWQIRDLKSMYITETKEKVSELGLANSSARLLPKNTVVLSRTASVGFAGIMGSDMATTQDFANWVPTSRLVPEYLLFVFRSMDQEFARLKYGSTHNTIYMPDIAAFRFALPPKEEQKKIVEHVIVKTHGFDDLIKEAERVVELLIERRTALISAAVTGKIDVRGSVPATPEEVGV